MSCEAVERAVVEGGEIDRAHLAACEGCRGLWRTHEALSSFGALQGKTIALESSRASLSVRAAVARRHRERAGRWAVAAGALAAAVLAFAWVRPSDGASMAEHEPDGEVFVAAETGAPSDEWLSAFATADALLDEAWDRDLERADESYAAFGELALWLAPTDGEQQVDFEEVWQ